MGIKRELNQHKEGQMKIQQMTFMILAVFIFFILVGLFFIRIQFKDLYKDAEELNKEQAIASLQVIANTPELNCGTSEELCLDEDKLRVMSGGLGEDYKDFWPVASIKVRKVYPEPLARNGKVLCPAINCNTYAIHDDGQQSSEEHAAFVSLCKKVGEGSREVCEIGKLLIGAKKNER